MERFGASRRRRRAQWRRPTHFRYRLRGCAPRNWGVRLPVACTPVLDAGRDSVGEASKEFRHRRDTGKWKVRPHRPRQTPMMDGYRVFEGRSRRAQDRADVGYARDPRGD